MPVVAQSSSHLQPGVSSWRSRSSGSSTSSLSSSFSDITSSTSVSSSPPHSKTDAFFASPFSTRAPTPDPATPSAGQPHSPRSLTIDFFAAPTHPPSPPATSQPSKTSKNSYFASRIFPSRHTSTASRSPELHFVNLDETDSDSLSYHERVPSSASSESSVTSSSEDKRLPTPPPSVSTLPHLHRENTLMPTSPRSNSMTIDQSTPRPPHTEPTLRFERSLLLAMQKPKPEPESDVVEEAEYLEEDLQPGSLISIPPTELPPSRLPSPLALSFTITSPTPARSSHRDDHGTSTPKPADDIPRSSLSVTPRDNSNVLSSPSSRSPALPGNIDIDAAQPSSSNLTPTSTLRLLRSLGHGAFSSVWLAEDLSKVPLTLVSKKSVRDLRRRASTRERARAMEGDETREELSEGVSGHIDVVDGPARTEESNKRPQNRLREGLRSMLSFSKITASPTSMTAPPFPLPTTPSSEAIAAFAAGHSPSSPTTFSHEIGPLSRHPSYHSSSTNGSELSRNSSVRSVASVTSSPPRGPSLRLQPEKVNGTLSRDPSLKKLRDRVKGTRPGVRLGRAYLDERDGEMGDPRDTDEFGVLYARSREGSSFEEEGSSLSRQSSLNKGKASGRLVAVKMTPRRVKGAVGKKYAKEEEERTRVGFVREVEVLKHISHPNITPLLAHLSTPGHHILILPYLPGGDLLGLVNNDVAWGKLGESVLRRMWCELCKAVGWMHGVGLVHRDIKLENILLTTTLFSSLDASSPPPTLSSPSMPPPQSPLIKLSDFGLSRFVEIDSNGDAELLTTRCGSEAYAAPELVIGGKAGYDARKTDAWACGVVLFALVGRKLPFGEGEGEVDSVDGALRKKIGGERGGGAGRAGNLAERRQWLLKIAKGEWVWPSSAAETAMEGLDPEEDIVGQALVRSHGARRIVERLLVRDPRKRARIMDLWEDVWMCGGEDEEWWRGKERLQAKEEEEELLRRLMQEKDMRQFSPPIIRDFAYQQDSDEEPQWFFGENHNEQSTERPVQDQGLDEEEGFRDEDEEEEVEEGGLLLDQEGIDSITRQEVV